ncbi:hypothetical protein [Calothrix sp. NIES-2098]|uniref:hypothetical protein n=1 Tax=Calothrix sp. NIES-2098 TaxID=1954171 RepID=UPI0030DD2BA9
MLQREEPQRTVCSSRENRPRNCPPQRSGSSSRQSLSAVAHGGNHASSFKSAKPPNGLAPQDRAASPRNRPPQRTCRCSYVATLRVRQFLYAGEPVHRTGSPLR